MADDILTVWEFQSKSGAVYKLVDQGARDLIKEIMNFTEYLGVTTSAVDDGASINPIIIGGESVTAVSGNVVTRSSDNKEFIYSSTGIWQNFGELSGLGSLAFKDYVTATYTPAGTVSQPTFTGTEFTPAGTVSQPTFSGSELTSTGSYTPAGTVSNVAVGTKTVKQFKSAGTLPDLSVNNHRIIFTEGALPTGEDVSVGDGSVTSQPSFSGTAATISVKGTPAGTVSQPTFSGTPVTPAGTVSQPTFTGTEATIRSE